MKNQQELSAVRATAGRAGAAVRWGDREKTHMVRVFKSDAAWLLTLAPTSAQAVRKLREALEKIAHYDDNDEAMDDPYCADGHCCATIAREALAMPTD